MLLFEFRFDGGRVHPVVQLGSAPAVNLGCSISVGGRYLFYVRQEETSTDLAVVKNFR